MIRVHRHRCALVALLCACSIAYPRLAHAEAARDLFRLVQQAPQTVKVLAPVIPIAPYLAASAAEATAAAGLGAGALLAGGWIALPIMLVGAVVVVLLMPTQGPPPLKIDLQLFPYPPGYFDEVATLYILPDGSMEFQDEKGDFQKIEQKVTMGPGFMFDLKGNLGIPVGPEGFPDLATHDWLVDPAQNQTIVAQLEKESKRHGSKKDKSDEATDEGIRNALDVRFGLYTLISTLDALQIAFLTLPIERQLQIEEKLRGLKGAIEELSHVYAQQRVSKETLSKICEVLKDEAVSIRQVFEELKIIETSEATFVRRLKELEGVLGQFPAGRADFDTFIQASFQYFKLRSQLLSNQMLVMITGLDAWLREEMYAWLLSVSDILAEMENFQGPSRELFWLMDHRWAPALNESVEEALSQVSAENREAHRILLKYEEFLRPYAN